MRLNLTTDYGLRIILYLAMENRVCTSHEIAQSMDIPRDFLVQLSSKLRKAGFIDSIAGRKGGYYLTTKPEDINIFDVMRSMGDSFDFVGHTHKVSHRERAGKEHAGRSISTLENVYQSIQLQFEETLTTATFDQFLNTSYS